MAIPHVKEVLDFLTENGFSRAASALWDDVLARGGTDLASGGTGDEVGEEEEEKVPWTPILPPVRTGIGRGSGGDDGGGLRSGSASSTSTSSSSSDAFVSIGTSPEELNNPYGIWTTTPAEADDSSDNLSEFGTAREYNDSNIFSDTYWYEEKRGGYFDDPYMMSTNSACCQKEDRFLMSIQAEEQFGKHNSSGFPSEMSIDYSGRPECGVRTGCEDCTKIYDSSVSSCDCCSGIKECQKRGSAEQDQNSSSYTNTIMPDRVKGMGVKEETVLGSNMEKEGHRAVNWEHDFSDHSHHKSNPGEVLKDMEPQPSEKELHIHTLSSSNGGGEDDPDPGYWEGDLSADLFHQSNPAKESKNMEPQLLEKELHVLTLSSVNANADADQDYAFSKKGNDHPKYYEKDSPPTSADCDDLHGDFNISFVTKKHSESNEKDARKLEHGKMVGEHQVYEPTADGREDNGINNGLELHDSHEDEYEIFELRIIHRKNRTGFEENKDLQIILNSVIAGRYYVTEYLGSAAFSKVVQAHDLQTGMDVCLKIIKNDKDFFDQSLDEIKLLKFVNKHDPVDERHILRLYDYFYHQEHLFIVCELLKANLYEFQKYNQESGGEVYYTFTRIQIIARQCLEALEYLHHLGIIHCDLKPENILIKSYSRCEIKVIDLGSSCFQTDNLCSYVQSRSYRAPEVILGLSYDQRIDIWSFGCILAELFSGEVLFPNDSVVLLLARMIGILGPIDMEMLEKGQEIQKYFTDDYDLYHTNEESGQVEYIIPQKSSLARHLEFPDPAFTDFLAYLLQTNPKRRPTAKEALQHPWLSHPYQ